MAFDASSMAALLESFRSESEEGLADAEQMLLQLEQTPDDAAAVDSVFRSMHTLKGNAGIFDFVAVSKLAHAMEDVLDRVRAKKSAVTPALVTMLLEGIDLLKNAVSESIDSPRDLNAAEENILVRLRGAQRRRKKAEPAAAAPATAVLPDRQPRRTIRIDVAKLDRLLDLSGEIGIARGRVAQMIADPSVDRMQLLESDRDAIQLHFDLQELVMKLRMLPVGPMLGQFHRTVRDLARSLDKEADLVVEGEDVEVDMAVLDQLKDPLTHMIRNSLDHGIETCEARLRGGKPRAGTITIRTFHDAGTVVIEVRDDGAGIDHVRVLERARARGLAGDGELSAREMAELLFLPGFSTAREVTEVSGRGVGLDVVRKNIEAIHGTVSISSASGAGTTVRIRLPLTLAVVEGLRVRVAGESYIIPMDAVVEALDVPARTRALATGMLRWRDADIPFIRLRDSLGLVSVVNAMREHVVVVRGADDERVGLIVDGLDGECQTLVKPLPAALQGTKAISGSAILPDGSIAFIVEISMLIMKEKSRRSAERAAAGEASCF